MWHSIPGSCSKIRLKHKVESSAKILQIVKEKLDFLETQHEIRNLNPSTRMDSEVLHTYFSDK
jgi:hypothetical protein